MPIRTRIAAALAAGLALVCLAAPARAAYIGAGQLLDFCQGSGEADKTFCIAYLFGVVDGVDTVQQARPDLPKAYCPPADATLDILQDKVIAYLRAHPENRSYSASGVVRMALHEAYPC
jgi:hypothetical protein